MYNFKKIIFLSSLVLAIGVQPVFADANLQVFLWNNDNIEMSENHKIGDNSNRFDASFGMSINATSIPVGKVTFNVTNTSDYMMHEMVVSKLLGVNARLPFDADISRVKEDVIGTLGEVSDLEPNTSGSLVLTLDAGTYALYCNIAGHYDAGMWKIIEVK